MVSGLNQRISNLTKKTNMAEKINLPEESKPYLEILSEMPKEQAMQVLKDAIENPTIKTTKNQNGTSLTSLSPRVKTLDQLLKVAKVDKNKYSVKKFKVKKWEVGLNLDGVAAVEELYAVSADLSPNADYLEFQRIEEDLLKDFQSYKPIPYKPNAKKKSKSGYMLEVNIFDLHFGKLCWNGETGEDYDTKIASKRFHNAIDDIVGKAVFHDVDKIVFPVGNDFFNSDNLRNTTTNLTPQDEDLRWQKTYTNGRKLIVEGIDKLRTIAPVDVVIVQGNHDFQRSFYLGDSLTAGDASGDANGHSTSTRPLWTTLGGGTSHVSNDYIKMAGGLSKNSSGKKFLVKAMTGQRFKLNNNYDLESGDIIFVAEKIEYNDEFFLFKEYLTSISQIAVLLYYIQFIYIRFN